MPTFSDPPDWTPKDWPDAFAWGETRDDTAESLAQKHAGYAFADNFPGRCRMPMPPYGRPPGFWKSKLGDLSTVSWGAVAPAFVRPPKVRIALHLGNLRAIDKLLGTPEGMTMEVTIGALNWRSIRAGSWEYVFTTGTPDVWFYNANWTSIYGLISDAAPMRLYLGRFDRWIHRAHVLIHEIEGHGTNEYGMNLPGDNHTDDRFAMMSRSQYPEINPFLPVQFSGYARWGMAAGYTGSEFDRWTRIAGPPMYVD